MKRTQIGIVAAVAVICLTSFWLSLVAFTPASRAQQICLATCGYQPLLDWDFIRKPAQMAFPYSGEGIPELYEGSGPISRAGLCTPPLVMISVRWLPDTAAAGWAFSTFGLIVYLAAAGYFLRRRTGFVAAVQLAAISMSLPLIFAFYVGNVILFAAAAALVFLSDYDADTPSRRRMAALALAVAFAIKIAPMMLGFLYFGRGFRKRLPEVVLAAVMGTLLLLLPFAFYGGTEGFIEWLADAAANSSGYAFRNPIGLCGIWAVLGHDAFEVHGYAVVLAVACLVAQGFARGIPKILLAVAGMLMLPPTMMIYTLSYLLPVVLAQCDSGCRRSSVLAAMAFVCLSCPLQLFVHGFCVQPLLSGLGIFLALLSVAGRTEQAETENVI